MGLDLRQHRRLDLQIVKQACWLCDIDCSLLLLLLLIVIIVEFKIVFIIIIIIIVVVVSIKIVYFGCYNVSDPESST
jgi:hypothetical protein